MVLTRDWLITALIQSKLSIRRAFRNWRRREPTVLHSDNDALKPADTTTKRRHPAQLPIAPSDNAPRYLPVLLYVFALIPRLYKISYPPSVVFDEVHFMRFVRAYYYGEYFFDIHPPLGKLVLYIVTKLFCGAPTLKYELNGEEFGSQKYVPLRVTSALFGAAVSPLSFLICREMGLSLPAALVPAVTQAVEHLGVIESRLVLIDAQLMAFMALTLLLALRMWGARRGRRWGLVLGTALAGAAALSVKWTALVTPALVAIVSITAVPFASAPLELGEMAGAGCVVAVTYTVLFWIHFGLLPKSGRGDAFMKPAFRKTLIGSKNYQKGYRGAGFFGNFAYLNYEMFVANRGIKTRHHWESRWWQWVFNMRGLLYYNEMDEEMAGNEKIYVIVNPAVTVVTVVCVTGFLVICTGCAVKTWRGGGKWVMSRKTRAFVGRGVFLFSGWALNLLPYVEVARCTFVYHYLPGLFYALLATANVIDAIPSAKRRTVISGTVCAVVIAAYVIWSGWIYATPLPLESHKWRQVYGKQWE